MAKGEYQREHFILTKGLTSYETISKFASERGIQLTIMENGEQCYFCLGLHENGQ